VAAEQAVTVQQAVAVEPVAVAVADYGAVAAEPDGLEYLREARYQQAAHRLPVVQQVLPPGQRVALQTDSRVYWVSAVPVVLKLPVLRETQQDQLNKVVLVVV
jgi:DhnA family fructose-bisphosphate aldolase class Ia